MKKVTTTTTQMFIFLSFFFFLITSHHTDYTCGNTFTAEREKNLTSNMVFMRRNLIVAFKTECCLQFFRNKESALREMFMGFD